jgi:hypothetical protein
MEQRVPCRWSWTVWADMPQSDLELVTRLLHARNSLGVHQLDISIAKVRRRQLDGQVPDCKVLQVLIQSSIF